MALYQWIETIGSSSIPEHFSPLIAQLGLQMIDSVSNDLQIYALTPRSGQAFDQQPIVSVLVTWCNRGTHEVQIEVRSGTGCEQIAQQLRTMLVSNKPAQELGTDWLCLARRCWRMLQPYISMNNR